MPLAEIDPTLATSEIGARLNLEAIYTALLTLSAEQEDAQKPGSSQKTRFPDLERQGRQFSALTQLNKHPYLVLLGDPGSGKSTFVNFVTMCLAGASLGDKQTYLNLLTAPLPDDEGKDEEERQPWEQGPLLPIRVILRDFAAHGLPPAGQKATVKDLWTFLATELEDVGLQDAVPSLQAHLRKHGGLILFDGLDEVPETEDLRVQVKEVIEEITGLFCPCRVIVTSRTYAYQNPRWRLQSFVEGKLQDFARATLASFTEGQIRRFINCWYEYMAPLRGKRREDALGEASDLQREILNNVRLRELAERPLLLTQMTILHASRGGTLPQKRVELYKETVELLLDRWERRKFERKDDRGQSVVTYHSLSAWLKVDKDRILRLLSKLAYEAHAEQPETENRTADISEEKLAAALLHISPDKTLSQALLLDHLRDRAGLLVLSSKQEDAYTFLHRTFQEYLAACFLTDYQYPKMVAQLARQNPNRWREVVLLAGAKAAGGTSSAIWLLVQALCWREVDDPDTTHNDARGALLAGQALAETVSVDQIEPYERQQLHHLQRWLVAILTEYVPSGTPFPAVERALAGNLLAVLGDPRPGVGLREDGLPDIDWCEVPEGTFLMGSDPQKDEKAYDDEQPQHEVRLLTYQMSRYPVTNAQYRAFIEDGGYTEKWQQCWAEGGWEWREESHITEPDWAGGEFDLHNHPVVRVSWYEAVAFCEWLTQRLRKCGALPENHSIRLPTEAEWEKAARGTDGRLYSWGNEQITPELANYDDTGLGVTSTVGCFPRGAGPYGCEDLSGNVYEWCLDWFDEGYYKKSPKQNPQGPASGSGRVLCGGGWGLIAGGCWAELRLFNSPGDRFYDIGFRLLRT